MDFCMKEGKSSHLSEFNSIFRQLVALKFVIDDDFKATILLWLMDLCMKEGKSSHLSEFNSIFSQPVALKFVIDNEFKATLWL